MNSEDYTDVLRDTFFLNKILTTMKVTTFATSLLLTGIMAVSAQTKLVIKGSDTLGAKMVPQLSEAYKAAGNNTGFEIAAEGSSSAFTALLAGTAEIGMSSRDVKDKEKNDFIAKGEELVETTAAWDMIAVVVNDKNPVRNLTLKQVEDIFTGDITDWSQVGGAPGSISVYTRNTSSGTYKTFQKLGMNKRDYGSDTQKMAGNQQIAEEVSKNVNGIGYVGLAYAGTEGLKATKVEGVSAKPSKVAKYPLARKLYYYTVGEPTGEAKKFIDWSISSEKGKEVISKVGFIPVPSE